MKRGLSLLEVVVAGAILALILGLLLVAIPRSLMAQKLAVHRDYATQLALYEIEQIKSLPVGPASAVNSTGPDGVQFTTTPTLVAVPGFAPEELQTVRVVVTWQEHGQNLQLSKDCRVARVRQ